MSVKWVHMPLISRVSYPSELLISRVKLKFVGSVELLICVLHVSCNWIWPSCGTEVFFLFTKMVLILWHCLLNHPTEHHFGSSGMTLNERFTKYLKKGMEQDAAKNKKSPEIHRLVAMQWDFGFPSVKLEFWNNSRTGENGRIST